MSILLGILSVVFIAFARLDKRFYLGSIVCLVLFVFLMIMNDNKFLDFTYFFFAAGLCQLVISICLNFKEFKN